MILTFLGLFQLFMMSATSHGSSAVADGGQTSKSTEAEPGTSCGWDEEEEENLEDIAADIYATNDRCSNLEDIAADIYDLIKDIRDPEKPNTLEELEVVFEQGVKVHPLQEGSDRYIIRVEFTPTVPHCSLATLIGLCIRVKLDRSLPQKHKIDIFITKGTHSTEDEINKQINDKERIAAAMENPNLKELVERCVADHDA